MVSVAYPLFHWKLGKWLAIPAERQQPYHGTRDCTLNPLHKIGPKQSTGLKGRQSICLPGTNTNVAQFKKMNLAKEIPFLAVLDWVTRRIRALIESIMTATIVQVNWSYEEIKIKCINNKSYHLYGTYYVFHFVIEFTLQNNYCY